MTSLFTASRKLQLAKTTNYFISVTKLVEIFFRIKVSNRNSVLLGDWTLLKTFYTFFSKSMTVRHICFVANLFSILGAFKLNDC